MAQEVFAGNINDPAEYVQGGHYVGPLREGPRGTGLHEGECEALIMDYAPWLGDPSTWRQGKPLLHVDSYGKVISAADIPVNSPIGTFKAGGTYGSPDGQHDHAAIFRGWVKKDGQPWEPGKDRPDEITGMKVIEQIPDGYRTFGKHLPEETIMNINGGYLNNAKVFSTIADNGKAPQGKGIVSIGGATAIAPASAPPAPATPPQPPAHRASATETAPPSRNVSRNHATPEETQWLQERLANIYGDQALGKTGVDKDWGHHTEAALIRFQREEGLHPNGMLDEQTRTALDSMATLRRADKPAVGEPRGHAAAPSSPSQLAGGGHVYPLHQARLTVTSHFGPRLNPFDPDQMESHHGVDYRAPYGTPVCATMNGTVLRVGEDPKSGRYVVIGNADGTQSIFCHLSDGKDQTACSDVCVTTGQRVTAGENIGYVGKTGAETGPHLFYGMKNRHGEWVDPTPYYAPPQMQPALVAYHNGSPIAPTPPTAKPVPQNLPPGPNVAQNEALLRRS